MKCKLARFVTAKIYLALIIMLLQGVFHRMRTQRTELEYYGETACISTQDFILTKRLPFVYKNYSNVCPSH